MSRIARLVLLRILPVVVVALAIAKAIGGADEPEPTPREIAARFLVEAGLASGSDGTPRAERPLFTEVGTALGLDMVHDRGAHGRHFLIEIMGSGGAFLDADGDRDLDVFLAGGGAFLGDGAGQTCRLYRNDGARFEDVTAATGAGVAGPCFGVACADFDDDGDVDVYVTRYGPNALLRNDGDASGLRFTEIGHAAGVDDPGMGMSATFLDYDRDGHLDLYVANYVVADAETAKPCTSVNGTADYCPPTAYPPAGDRLYRNRGDGTFEDVTDASGIGAELGNGLGVLASDFDGDGWIDIYVANDQTPAFLWRNREGRTFENVAAIAGCAYDGRGVAIAGMGVAGEDLDDDGDADLVVTNIRNQPHLVLRNDGGLFTDTSASMGIAPLSMKMTGFGVSIFDQDLDGSLDAFVANGKVGLGGFTPDPDHPYAQPDQFLRLERGQFRDATASAGLELVEVGRGSATGDFDDDGDLDVLVTNNDGQVRLLRNDADTGHAWLIVDARTGPAGRAALGARVSVVAGGRTFHREIRAQQSYLCSGDPRAHFGLGAVSHVDRLVVDWPDGTRSTRDDVPVNRVVVFAQPAATEGATP